MLDRLLGAMQNHHPGIFTTLKRALRNQFPWQNVIVIAKSCAHRSIESSADPRGTALPIRFAAAPMLTKEA
jgi:L-ribulose-5-phosphate 3-epimerase UlaE